MASEYITGARIAFDPAKRKESRLEVSVVRLAMFPGEENGKKRKKGSPDHRIRVSIGHSKPTSWFIHYKKGEDLSKVTADKLIPDPVHLNQVYILFKGDEVPPVVKVLGDKLEEISKKDCNGQSVIDVMIAVAEFVDNPNSTVFVSKPTMRLVTMPTAASTSVSASSSGSGSASSSGTT